ncbi:hypothetical protein [Reinekea blandensis]|uniref:Uncharacterized protein n=1 Tax=Reinekea blandensis MED297 TaxID=314283 RepID=A4BJY6_9GAMM|nr:hypothetical protein [Reinekea blandensis]EAR07587.1 hypothetical protein MED297_00160 [Reinekea sp. MED297] [Reinekea blandensis MED297]
MTTQPAARANKRVKVEIWIDDPIYQQFLERGKFNHIGFRNVTPEQGITDALQLHFTKHINDFLKHYLTAKDGSLLTPPPLKMEVSNATK